MALITCPTCDSEDIRGVARPDGQRLIACESCGHEWLRGEVRRSSARPALRTVDTLRESLPTAEQVRPEVLERLARLTTEFVRPEPDPDIEGYRSRYQALFSREQLSTASPEALHHFANSATVAGAGNMTGFNRSWAALGPDRAAHQLRTTIGYLLHGPESLRLEDRITELVNGRKGLGFTGFKEALLTKVLCVVEPDRFLPVLKYSAASGGKREIAAGVFDLELPEADKVAYTIGRLVVWGNDLLQSLVSEQFDDLQQGAAFLLWANKQKTDVPA
ncbi:hypothetical protein GB931_01390 [Modestobacter sp. I12A-02628]|uniref:Uncharacterized protein n=1 Tax=Goekera deserti TaxID=2497753 RepID=A0A7K3WHY9_9ACTN|nr:hypothetical protein [Goekera deserti]MPQ96595.1 hypothetical protein [Goekera deserti]NDI47093.1 hypothetical protein [Goekera deserti]NEL55509.1 hypothetical protein [Goekera deserti]